MIANSDFQTTVWGVVTVIAVIATAIVICYAVYVNGATKRDNKR